MAEVAGPFRGARASGAPRTYDAVKRALPTVRTIKIARSHLPKQNRERENPNVSLGRERAEPRCSHEAISVPDPTSKPASSELQSLTHVILVLKCISFSSFSNIWPLHSPPHSHFKAVTTTS